MSSHPIQHNPSAVAPTFVNISPSERGDATNMPYMIVDPSNPMGASQGTGTVDVDYTWGGSVTILYFGTNAGIIDALNNDVLSLSTMSDPVGLVSVVTGLVSANGGNMDDIDFEIEAIKPDPLNPSLLQVVSLGSADVASSLFFGGTGPDIIDYVNQGGQQWDPATPATFVTGGPSPNDNMEVFTDGGTPPDYAVWVNNQPIELVWTGTPLGQNIDYDTTYALGPGGVPVDLSVAVEFANSSGGPVVWADHNFDVIDGNQPTFSIDIMSDGFELAVMNGTTPLVLVDSATNMPLTPGDITGDIDIANAYVMGSTTADPLATVLGSGVGPVDISTWNVVGNIQGIDILGNGADADPSNSDQFGFEYTPTTPVYDFALLGSSNSDGSIKTIAANAPDSGLYVWYGSGPSGGAMNKITFQPVKLDGTTYILDNDPLRLDIVVEPSDLISPNTFETLATKINTANDITGGQVGDLVGQPQHVLLVDGNGGNPISSFANIDGNTGNWWVRDGGDFQPFYSSDSTTFSYSALGLSEGDFSNYLKFHVDGDNNTAEQVGFFTTNDYFFNALDSVLNGSGSDAGGTLFRIDTAGPLVSGTEFADVYQINDYHVSATAGSDYFVMGMGSSDQNTYGVVQNANYNSDGSINDISSDYSADMDILYVSWLPEGVVVDANFGQVSHGSGGPGSTADDVYTDYFAGIEVFDLTQYDDYFTGGGEVDINWIDPGSGNDEIHGVGSVFTVLDYSSVSNDFGVDIHNEGLVSNVPLGTSAVTIENAENYDGAVLLDNGDVDIYRNVDYFIGTDDDDNFHGGSGSDQFNAMFSDNASDTFQGGDGADTLIIEDKFSNRGIFGDFFDEESSTGVSVNSIDLDTIVVTKGVGSTYHVTGTNVRTYDSGGTTEITPDSEKREIDIELTGVERIDIREYVEDATAGKDNAELYVVDSYELLEGGQGDLVDMYHVTSLGHSTFDIHDGETPEYQTIDILGKTTNIYYSGHHTDFNRFEDLSLWTAGGAAAYYAGANSNEIWQGHESIFFAWYDPDGAGNGVDAFEIAVKRDNDDDVWRIANKVFDTFSTITLTQTDADTLNAMSHSIQQDSSLEFGAADELRVYLGAAYQDITDVISSNVDVSNWDFSQTFSTSRSTYYVEIPNGTSATTQQVKVEYNNALSAWELKADEEILVNIPSLNVTAFDDAATLNVDESASVVAGSDAAELIKAGDGADTMLGGGGADTYEINGGDADSNLAPDAFGVQGDIINEIGGDIASSLGDSLNFTNIQSIDDIDFARNKIRFEEAESTLTITAHNVELVTTDPDGIPNNGDETTTEVFTQDIVHVFDHFNDDLPFRQVEQLLLDEGWELGQIWNLVADGQGGTNRDVLVGGTGDDTLVSGGGADVMQGGDGADTFKLGSSDVTIDKIGEAHGDVTMIRDFVTGEDFIDLSELGINAASEVSTQTVTAAPEDGGTTHTYLVDGSHVLAELTMSSDTTFADEDLILL